jgi:hypothetical protein
LERGCAQSAIRSIQLPRIVFVFAELLRLVRRTQSRPGPK